MRKKKVHTKYNSRVTGIISLLCHCKENNGPILLKYLAQRERDRKRKRERKERERIQKSQFIMSLLVWNYAVANSTTFNLGSLTLLH